MILLARDTAAVELDIGPEAICARHRSYCEPVTRPGCLHLLFDEFAADVRKAMRGRSTLVLVGVNKIVTPSNRTREVFEILFNASREWRKISVDRTLFSGEPWRAWFHWGFLGAPYREYTYSYLAESHWKAHRDGIRTDDPFSFEAIAACGAGFVRSDYEWFFERIEVQTIEVSAAVHDRYQREKETAFDEEHTLSAIIRRLAAIAQEVCPERSIPTPARFFERPSHRIVRTDLKVDEYLTRQVLDLGELTNRIAEHFHGR